MGEKISDDMLEAFAVVGTPAECGGELARRWGELLDRATLYTPYAGGEGLKAELIGALRGALGA